MKIRDSVAFVTGANRGLGLAFARELLAAGARKVYAASRKPAILPFATNRSCMTSPGLKNTWSFMICRSPSVLTRRKPVNFLMSGIRPMKRAWDCFRAKIAHVERAGSPSNPASFFIRSMLTMMATVFASTYAATQAVTMFR
jgi:hypothetical protein